MKRSTTGVEPSTSVQVFVDESGRRGRWLRLAGAGVTALCAAYVGIIAVGLSQTAVGPLIVVPSDSNGQVAGFPNTAGTVPGLLAPGGVATAQASPRTSAPRTRSRATTKLRTARTKKATRSHAAAVATSARAGNGSRHRNSVRRSHFPHTASASPSRGGRASAAVTRAA